MYKVFITNKTIFISNTAYNSIDNDISKTYNYLNNNDLKLVIESFATDAKISNLYIINSKPHKILNKILRIFKTIKAAGGLVKNMKDEYLFIFRRNKWDLPKGKKDSWETIRHCAIREVKEECGLKKIHIIHKLTPTYHLYKLKNEWVIKKTCWYLMFYPLADNPIPQTEEDITDIKWFTKSQFDIPLQNTYPSIHQLLSELL
jgi:8-oxo-dGTP pyrophosphatase MutT (NUDIX family)